MVVRRRTKKQARAAFEEDTFWMRRTWSSLISDGWKPSQMDFGFGNHYGISKIDENTYKIVCHSQYYAVHLARLITEYYKQCNEVVPRFVNSKGNEIK